MRLKNVLFLVVMACAELGVQPMQIIQAATLWPGSVRARRPPPTASPMGSVTPARGPRS